MQGREIVWLHWGRYGREEIVSCHCYVKVTVVQDSELRIESCRDVEFEGKYRAKESRECLMVAPC